MTTTYPTVFASTGSRRIALQPPRLNRTAWWRADSGICTGGARKLYSKGYFKSAINNHFDIGIKPFIWSGWIKRIATGASVICSSYQDATNYWLVEFNSSNKVHFIAKVGDAIILEAGGDTAITTLNKWYHIFITAHRTDTDYCLVFINGVNDTDNVSAVANDTNITYTDANLFIGQMGDDTLSFSGGIEAIGFGTLDSDNSLENYLNTILQFFYNYAQPKFYGDINELQLADYGIETDNMRYYNCNEITASDDLKDQSSSKDLTFYGINLVANSGFEIAGGGGADVFANWFEYISGGSGTISDETTIVYEGSHAAKLQQAPDTMYIWIVQSGLLTVGHQYTLSGKFRNNGAGTVQLILSTGGPGSGELSLTTTYTTKTFTGTAIDTGGCGFIAYSGTGTIYADTISLTAFGADPINGACSAILSDSSVEEKHGILTGYSDAQLITSWHTDVPNVPVCENGYSLYFDSISNYLVLPSTLTFTGEFSIAFWLKAGAAGVSNFGLIGLDYTPINIAAGEIYIDISNLTGSTVFDDNNAADGTWHHITITRDNNDVFSVYIDGIKDSNDDSTYTGTLVLSTIGYTDGYLGGNLDDIRIYRGITLTDAQVSALVTGDESNPNWPGMPNGAFYTCNDGPQTLSPVDGDPIISWQSKEGLQLFQTNVSVRPLYKVNIANRKAAVLFENENFLASLEALFSGSQGTLVIIAQPTDTDDMCLVSQYDESNPTTKELVFSLDSNYPNLNIGTNDVSGDVSAAEDETICISIVSDGSQYTIYTNIIENGNTVNAGNDNGDWFSDVNDETITMFGAWNSGSYFQGYIFEIILYSDAKTEAQIKELYNAYIKRYYGVS